MPWIAGYSRAGYDHVGRYNARPVIDGRHSDFIGNTSSPGAATPGTFTGAEEPIPVLIKVRSHSW